MSRRISKQLDKRISHKQERAATRAAIDGARPRQPQGSNWSTPIEPVPIVDDSITQPGHKSNGGRCPKSPDGMHKAVLKQFKGGWLAWGGGWRTVCEHCGKRRWGGGSSRFWPGA